MITKRSELTNAIIIDNAQVIEFVFEDFTMQMLYTALTIEIKKY